jgi:TolB-like protein
MDRQSETEARLPTLAVLPFTRAGDADEDALLAQGLNGDICSELTRFRGLRVISPASAAVVANQSDEAIAANLRASHVLRGHLRRHGTRLLLDIALSCTRDATQLWSERLEVPAGEVARSSSRLSGGSRRHSTPGWRRTCSPVRGRPPRSSRTSPPCAASGSCATARSPRTRRRARCSRRPSRSTPGLPAPMPVSPSAGSTSGAASTGTGSRRTGAWPIPTRTPLSRSTIATRSASGAGQGASDAPRL